MSATWPIHALAAIGQQLAQQDPLTATALALEFRKGEKVVGHALIISFDLAATRRELFDPIRARQGSDLYVPGWSGASGDPIAAPDVRAHG